MSRIFQLRISLLAVALALFLAGNSPAGAQHADHGTPVPPPSISCDPSAATPMAMGEHAEPGDTTAPVEFDVSYIDMMIPHHGSIIALAKVALPTLTDQRLIDMATAIVSSQQAEIDELQALRDRFYPDAPMTMAMGHAGMETTFPSLMNWSVPMDQWANIMSSDWQVQTFCAVAADEADLAFVRQTIPHHEMAVLASQDALTMAVHPEVKAIAERVIPAQQGEIDVLRAIEAELIAATPAA